MHSLSYHYYRYVRPHLRFRKISWTTSGQGTTYGWCCSLVDWRNWLASQPAAAPPGSAQSSAAAVGLNTAVEYLGATPGLSHEAKSWVDWLTLHTDRISVTDNLSILLEFFGICNTLVLLSPNDFRLVAVVNVALVMFERFWTSPQPISEGRRESVAAEIPSLRSIAYCLRAEKRGLPIKQNNKEFRKRTYW